MIDNHAAEYSKMYVGTLSNLCEMYELLIQQYRQKYSVSLTKWPFLFVQVNFYTSKSF